MVSQYPPALLRAHALTTATPKAAFRVTIRHNRPNGLTAIPHFHPLTHTRQQPRQPRTTSENAPLMVSMRLVNPRASAACFCHLRAAKRGGGLYAWKRCVWQSATYICSVSRLNLH